MVNPQSKKIWTVPNVLTLIRIGIVPLFMVFMYWEEKAADGPWGGWAAFLFVFAALTDQVDGYIARHYNQGSKFGVLLDPLADKLLVTAALVMLIPMERGVPAWAVVLMLGREIAVTGLRGLASEEGIVITAMPLGKLKAFFQMFCVPLLLYKEDLLGLPILLLGQISFWAALLLAIFSGGEYFVRFLRKII